MFKNGRPYEIRIYCVDSKYHFHVKRSKGKVTALYCKVGYEIYHNLNSQRGRNQIAAYMQKLHNHLCNMKNDDRARHICTIICLTLIAHRVDIISVS